MLDQLPRLQCLLMINCLLLMLGIQEWLCAGMGKVKTVNPVVPLMHKHCCYHGSQLGVLASYSFLFLTMFQQLLFLEITSLTKATSDKGLKMLVALLCGQVIFAIIYNLYHWFPKNSCL